MKLLFLVMLPLNMFLVSTEWVIKSYRSADRYRASHASSLSSTLQEVMVYPSAELQVETPLAAHPANKDIFAGAAITGVYPGGYTTGFYRTTNGGASWTGTNAIKDFSGTIISTVGDPQIVITPNDRFVIAYLKMVNSVMKIGVSYSTNNGSNWTSPYFLPGVDTADKVVMYADDHIQSPYYGRCYIAYSERGGTYFSYSTNSGTTWSTAKRICPTNRYSRVGASIATGPLGEVYVSWPFNQNSTDYIGFAGSTDGGVSWDSTDFAITAKASAPGFRLNLNLVKMNGLPVIGVDKSGGPAHGNVYLSFIERKTSGSPALDTCDIILVSSTNKGTSWSPKSRVNASSISSKSYQLFHQMNIDRDGNINFLYFDTRDTPTNDSFMVYMSRSTDRGATFADFPASDHKFKLKQLPSSQRLFGVPSYIGSYIGLASSSDRIIGLWYDNIDEQYRAYSVSYPISTELTVKAINQGLYREESGSLIRCDSALLYIRSASAPYNRIDSARICFDSLTFSGECSFSSLPSGDYYIEVDHIKGISTCSAIPVNITSGQNNFYDFTISQSAAYGNNLIIADADPLRYAIYSGEISQDEVIDITDVSAIENDAMNYVYGNVITDINGDGFVDVTDVVFADYGAANFVMSVTP